MVHFVADGQIHPMRWRRLLSGTSRPQRWAKRRQQRHPSLITLQRSWPIMSSTQCCNGSAKSTATAQQNHAGNRLKFCGNDLDPNNLGKAATKRTPLTDRSHCTMTDSSTWGGDPGTCLQALAESLVNPPDRSSGKRAANSRCWVHRESPVARLCVVITVIASFESAISMLSITRQVGPSASPCCSQMPKQGPMAMPSSEGKASRTWDNDSKGA